ncbi:TRAP transporter substrate-binding protein [Allosediminivita pacifica]|uniref:TRAP-type C4-dicarboxylate transport system substrate-binding protein n=1 Tax=Allosediminivita pacifica TaxID=1267769 RepID=A0A2T6AR18_9RHOB|nr:TRAP transporter substrate-binding protein [Allosediminivita pacifica]PTX46253.1 TRAP-type C4-dicarboxylate transport system substrate-binding protein [Allosediminivita pacifica]GGB17632.1 ABC transporter substrate-binding protein [Allosediminivita pacifica]
MRLPLKHAALALAFAMPATAFAQAETTIKVLGFWGNQPQIDDVDRPMWESIEEETDGRIEIQYLTLNEAGLNGSQALRFLRRGQFDIMTINPSYVSGDEPSLVAVDLPGLAYDYETLREISDVYRPTMAERLERFDGVLLSHWPFNPQIVWCNEPVDSITDLEGRKVRVSGAPAADTLDELGATAVNLTGGEVYQALERGLVNCGSTGSTYGYRTKWHEVANHLYNFPLGSYSQVVQVANKTFWDSLSEEDQEMIRTKMAAAEDELWAMAPRVHQQGVACATGEGTCELGGEPGDMTFTEVSEADKEVLAEIVNTVTIPNWKESCTPIFPECGERFDETIGQVINGSDGS